MVTAEAIIQALPGMAWVINSQNELIACNHAFKAQVGIYNNASLLQDFWAQNPDLSQYGTEARVHRQPVCYNTTLRLTEEGVSEGTLYISSVQHPLDTQGALLFQFIPKVKQDKAALQTRPAHTAYETILNHISDLAWMKDCESRFVLVNEAFAHSCNRPQHQIIGQADSDIWPQALAEKYHQDDETVLHTGETLVLEEVLEKADGTVRVIETVKSPVLGENGKITGTVGIARDITERQHLLETLRQDRDYVNRIIQNTPALVVGIAPDGTTTFINPAVETATGYTPQEVIGKNWWRLFYPGNAYSQVEALFEAFKDGDVHNYEMDLTTKAGQKRTISWNSINRTNEQGQVLEVIGFGVDMTERKKTEQALRESERFARSTVDALLKHIAILDAEGTIIHVNKAWNTFAEQNNLQTNFVGMNYFDACANLSDGSVSEVVQGIKGVISGYKPSFSYEYPCETADGVKWFMMRVSRFQGDGPVRVVISHDNITERKLAEQEVKKLNRELQLQFSATFDQAAVGLCHTDLDGRWMRVNQKFCEIVGYSAEELLGQHFFNITHLDDVEIDIAVLNRFNRGEIENSAFEKRYIRKDGSTVWVNLTVSLFKDEQGFPKYYLALIEDISQRKKAEQDLRESEERFRNLADTAPVMIWMTDENSLCTYVNKPCLDFVGQPMTAMAGFSWQQFIHPDDLDYCLHTIRKAKSRLEQYTQEFRLRHYDGSYRWVIEVGLPRFTPNGDYAGYIGSCFDIHERKEMEQRVEEAKRTAEQANIRKNQFLANMSHELRTPLHTIITGASMGLEGMLGPLNEKQAEYLNLIYRSGEHLLEIINDLLDIAKIEAGKLNLSIQEIDLIEFIEETTHPIEPLLTEKMQHFAIELSPKLPSVFRADPVRMKQVLLNLLSNAYKFTPSHKTIILSVQLASPDEIVFSVKDEGPGIPQSDLDRILQPFEQGSLPNNNDGQIKGTGLGLPLVKKIVELHQGRLEINTQVNQGSEFKVYLSLKPLQDATPHRLQSGRMNLVTP